MASLLAPAAAAADDQSFADWWSENFEVHGFLTSKAYFRSPGFDNDVEISSWRSELNLEAQLDLYQGEELRLGLFTVVRPIWDGIYEIQPDLWGDHTKAAAFGTAPAFPDDPSPGAQFPLGLGLKSFAQASGSGKSLPCFAAFPGACEGGRVEGEFTIINSDTGSLFTGTPGGAPELIPAVSIDDRVFFGRVTAPWRPRGSGQDKIGGNASGLTYEDMRDGILGNAGLAPDMGLAASLAMASMPLATPLNAYQGAFGDRGSLKRGSVDINRREDVLKLDCLDNAHPWCFARELYLEMDYKNTFIRLGKQQIVWGKTDAFRLQDKINPQDLGYHNVFPDLEERRIPQLALDLIQSFGDVGPFQDVSLEFAWVFDRFIPDQFGQCGEPYAFTAACEARADAGGHQLFNFSLANVEEIDWRFKNTEPGLRLEFRLPEPSIAFSLSAFYTFQDTPVAKFRGHYSTENPNPAVMLFLQGLLNPNVGAPPGTPVVTLIENFAAAAGVGGGPGTTVWSTGFDPYAHDTTGAPTGTLELANDVLLGAWDGIFNFVPSAMGGCEDLPDGSSALAACGSAFSIFGLPWSASEATLEYPRVLALGGSADYQIPGIDTVLRLEVAADLDRSIQDTSRLEGISKSTVFQAAVGLDRSTFIPFLNRSRTAFISVQTFFEHIISNRTGMVPYETSIISTLFMQNYWRNDSIVLTNFAAADWSAKAIITGPSLRWLYDDHLFFDIGVNLLWGQQSDHNIRDLCSGSTLSCLRDPTTWQDGNWQTLNAGLSHSARAPWWAQESFADKFMENRDEFWVGVTYQF